MTNILEPLTINNVISEKGVPRKFYIPSYQRGYRWDEDQVNELLDDIYEFEPDNIVKYYCLQPIVVKRREDDSFEVIDGQQRLTTIFIILSYLKKKRFEIKLETRSNSQDFLTTIERITEPNDEYIDYYYISNAYITAKKWFAKKEANDESSIESDMHSKICNKVQVIWYEVNDPKINPIDIFTRLNIGKIPLTDAELIKALLLNSNNFPNAVDQQSKDLEKNRIAREWDFIEQRLSDNEFWYFLNKEINETPNRIDFLFILFVEIQGYKDKKQHSVFYAFQDQLQKKNNDSVALWDDFYALFEKIIDLYSDRTLFHLIGYLIKTGYSFISIINDANTKPKNQLTKHLKMQIKSHLAKQAPEGVESLSFLEMEDYGPISDYLLLFNVVTCCNENNIGSRFSFSRYVTEKWSLEHIHAQNSELLHEQKEWIEWIEGHIATLDSLLFTGRNQTEKDEVFKIKKDYVELDKKKISEKVFKEFYSRILVYLSESGEEELHDISNLALLSKNINSTLNNAVFARKRQKIIELDKSGVFLLPATRNIFLKYYSNDMNNLPYWGATDRESYVNEMNLQITTFLTHRDGVAE